MKISKITLQWLVYHALRSDTAGHAELNLIEEISEALKENELEIEGYEKSEWIKLNPNNPDTFPPRGQYFITYGPGHMNVMFRYSEATETNEEFVNRFFGRYGFTHWRPAPKPPQDETK